MKINLFSISSLLIAIVCYLLSLIIFSNSRKKVHTLWAFFNIAVGTFGLGSFFVSVSTTYPLAFISWRLTLFGVAFIALFFYHFVYEFCGLKNKKLLVFAYIHGVLFAVLGISTNFIFNKLKYLFNEFYYYVAGVGFDIFFAIWLFLVFLSFYQLFKYIQKAEGLPRTQGRYLFWGMLLGFLSGSTTSFPSWGVTVYPAWDFFICVYAAISTYAILRYRLMDIRVAVSNMAIFLGVYGFVLGIPLIYGYKFHNWQIATWAMLIFATAGPFIYLHIQKRAEDRLLQEQRRYQATLRQASAGMGKIKDLNKLLNMIVYVLTHAIQIEHALIYIYDESQKQYVLGAHKSRAVKKSFIPRIDGNSTLIKYLVTHKQPIIFEEMNQKAQDFKDAVLKKVAEIISNLQADLVVPIFIDQNLIAIVTMGKKESGKPYTEDDLSVFGILANQTALAIENAKFYEDMKLTQEQLFQAEKMATIGTMADGLSHQINNRFHAMSFITGDALDTIERLMPKNMSDEIKQGISELKHALTRVEENVKQGGEIVHGLLRYTRKGDVGFVAVDVYAVFKSAFEMAQFKIKADQLKIVHDYDPANTPKVKANFTQLQEVFFNLIDNGFDAMMQRKNELKEPGYQPTLIVHVLKEENWASIVFEDNGVGVKEEDLTKLFTPFFTTKLSSKKGTGLGLYVIKKIIEDNHGGKVVMTSKYMQGTQTKLLLPIAEG